MSKENSGAPKAEKAEKTKETAHPKAEPKADHQAKADHQPKAEGKKGKGHTPMPGGCFSWGCKTPAKQFNFCLEHFDHFKFGLIKKTGEPAPDYEKKFEHYQAYKAKRSAQKAA